MANNVFNTDMLTKGDIADVISEYLSRGSKLAQLPQSQRRGESSLHAILNTEQTSSRRGEQIGSHETRHFSGFTAEAGSAPAVARASKPLPKRVFITDWEMKRLVKPGQKSVAVPAGAIVSPLSLDWLDYNCIEVIRD